LYNWEAMTLGFAGLFSNEESCHSHGTANLAPAQCNEYRQAGNTPLLVGSARASEFGYRYGRYHHVMWSQYGYCLNLARLYQRVSSFLTTTTSRPVTAPPLYQPFTLTNLHSTLTPNHVWTWQRRQRSRKVNRPFSNSTLC